MRAASIVSMPELKHKFLSSNCIRMHYART
jgi:hypothetical protein